VGGALVIDSFLHLKPAKLMPPPIVEEADKLVRRGQFNQLNSLCQAGDNLFSRVLRTGLSQGGLGLPAVRQAIQDQGAKEITRLAHRVNYMGFLGAIAPMMGLLGTVIGMISSFNVLGSAKGAARPDELAGGIAFALVTTCEGLVLAIPMMFFHNFFRDRVSRLGQDCSTLCERLLRLMGAVVEARTGAAPRPPEPAPVQAQLRNPAQAPAQSAVPASTPAAEAVAALAAGPAPVPVLIEPADTPRREFDV
jgi:biopolymer transport protein ExbB